MGGFYMQYLESESFDCSQCLFLGLQCALPHPATRLHVRMVQARLGQRQDSRSTRPIFMPCTGFPTSMEYEGVLFGFSEAHVKAIPAFFSPVSHVWVLCLRRIVLFDS